MTNSKGAPSIERLLLDGWMGSITLSSQGRSFHSPWLSLHRGRVPSYGARNDCGMSAHRRPFRSRNRSHESYSPSRRSCRLLAAATATAQQPASQAIRPAPQPTTAAQAPNRDTSYIDAQGTAHVTRVVPVPQTISPQAQLVLGRAVPDQAPPQSLADRRKGTDDTRHAPA